MTLRLRAPRAPTPARRRGPRRRGRATWQSERDTYEIVVAEPDTGCPDDLVISDFKTAPNAKEFVDLLNVGTETIDFATVDCVLGGFRLASYFGLPASGTLAPGATLRFGASAANHVDVPFPDGLLQNAFASLALLDRESLPNGTAIPPVLPDIVTSLVYLIGRHGEPQVFGFFHEDEANARLYCDLYAGELSFFGYLQCAALTAHRTATDGTKEAAPIAADLASMMEAALAEEGRTATETEATAVPTAFALRAAYPNPLSATAGPHSAWRCPRRRTCAWWSTTCSAAR